jgi:MSHA biogenesis protein MshG
MSTTFDYRARDAQGGKHQGRLGGTSAAAVARELATMGLVPVEIRAGPAGASAAAPAAGSTASAGRPAAPGGLLARLRQPSPKRLQASLSLICRELAALLRAGVPLMRALQLVADSSADEPVRAALLRITRDLDNGHNLVAAAEHEQRASGLITPYDIAMLQVGEQTGRLPEAFADLHRQREFAAATGEQVAAALRYPSFVILTCLIAVIVVNIWVIPAFAKVFASAHTELPALTQLLLGMSNLMKVGWPYGLALAGGGIYGWRRWMATPQGHLWWDQHKLRLPIIGRILEGIVLARLSGALASAISAGLTISDSLTVTARTLGNAWFEMQLMRMCNELARGTSITAAARNMGVLPPTMLQLFAIGEESGSLEELMREISVHYQAEVDYSVKRLSATLEPVLIWFLGIGVLILALGVFMPMWDLGKATVK